MTSALIIFVRNPILGQVKTRLARTIGDHSALSIYRVLLHHTCTITRNLDCDKFVFYADAVSENDLWPNDRFAKFLQEGADLGERMRNAFTTLFQSGYGKIAIIGSDCYELSALIIQDAFQQLDQHDVVIGSSVDGGYYLLAMRQLHRELFTNKHWSTPTVLAETLADCTSAHLNYFLLPALPDIDEEKDIPEPLKTFMNNYYG